MLQNELGRWVVKRKKRPREKLERNFCVKSDCLRCMNIYVVG